MEIMCSVTLAASQLGLMLEWFIGKVCMSFQGILHTGKEKNDDDNIIQPKISEQGIFISRCYNK
jgi:hypothetical protein